MMTEDKKDGDLSGGVSNRTKGILPTWNLTVLGVSVFPHLFFLLFASIVGLFFCLFPFLHFVNVNGATGGEKLRQAARFLFPWLVHFSITFCLILAVAAFFQIQIVALQQELEYLKLNLSDCDEEKPRNVRKRSSAELVEETRQGPGIQAAHLQGNIPFQHIEKEGKIGPWTISTTDDTFITLKEKNKEIEISQSGIYYIYAQVYYLTSSLHNSFQIVSHNGTEERKYHSHLVTCSSQGRSSIGETSCYTGFVGSLRSGQRLYLNQIEQNRIIHFTNGCSYFGVVLLKKNAALKRKK